MNFFDKFVLAPYIMKATSLISVHRRCGGNQFRHQFATLGILLDYKYFDDSILLKASLIHDLLEDWGDEQIETIRNMDDDGHQVIELVKEVTKNKDETKETYLKRLLDNGSDRAKILKCADRISNLTDLHLDTHTSGKIAIYLDHTEKYIIPMALSVSNIDFVKELADLIIQRRMLIETNGSL
jgi:GTP pyrophosphokinase